MLLDLPAFLSQPGIAAYAVVGLVLAVILVMVLLAMGERRA